MTSPTKPAGARAMPDFMIWHCAGCGAPAEGKKKPCGCATNVGTRKGPSGHTEQTWWDAGQGLPDPSIRYWVAELIRSEFDPIQCIGGRPVSGWDDNAVEVADKIIAALLPVQAKLSAAWRVLTMCARMAEDDGLWFHAETAAEAYVQQQLRDLCAAIEEIKQPASKNGDGPRRDRDADSAEE